MKKEKKILYLIILVVFTISLTIFNIFASQRAKIESLQFQVNECQEWQMKIGGLIYNLKENLKDKEDFAISAKLIIFELEGRD